MGEHRFVVSLNESDHMGRTKNRVYPPGDESVCALLQPGTQAFLISRGSRDRSVSPARGRTQARAHH